jgi:hypothetical protein
LFGHTILQ